MATTFDTPVLLTEVEAGRFRIFRGTGLPAGVPLKTPEELDPLYRITGPFDVYYQIAPPERDLSREEVLAWLDRARKLGCEVRTGDFDPRILRR